MSTSRLRLIFPCLALILALAACAGPSSLEQPVPVPSGAAPQNAAAAALPAKSGTAKSEVAPPPLTDDGRVRIYKGPGKTVLPPPRDLTTAPAGSGAADDVSLNFEGADVREVTKNILTDILNEGYIFDPGVAGTVTLRTTKPIPRSALLATLETVLRMNGAALIKEAGVFKVVPVANAVRGSLTPHLGEPGKSIPPGFSVRLVPLRYVGVREMARILDPFVKDAASLRADDLRNMIILFGTERELQHLVNTIEMFDVDWMAGMSVGLFTLLSADVKTVNAELDKIIGDKNTGPLAGILRIIPIERMNAFLIITPQARYLDQIKVWIERLDKGGDGSGSRLFVYNVQNGRAEKLAPLLTQVFTGRAPTGTSTPPTLAPGQVPATLSGPAAAGQRPGGPAPATSTVVPAPATANTGMGVAHNVNIIADKDNNALLIMASPGDYALIEAALKKLDVAARQVMIDVTIAEIILTDDLSLGLQGYFKDGEFFSGSLLTGTSTALGTAVPGFSYLWKPGGALGALAPGGIAASFNMLAKDSRVNIISRPNIIATDNQKAQIQVGDRVPTTSQTQTVSGTTSGIINSVQYLDTGIMLAVTPHINAGGLISLELNAEVSSANKTETSSIDSPTITKRTAQTTISVQSGETMVMGGLIREDKSKGSSGLPLVSQIPVLGALFGSQSHTSKRTELVMFITPRLISNDQQLRAATEELRKKLEYLGEVIPKAGERPETKGAVSLP